MKKILVPFFVFILIFSVKAQFSYPAFLIPDSLTENANAVIRKSDTQLTIESPENITVNVHFVITVFNKSADKLANIALYYDSFSKVNSISGTVYDKFGLELKKIKKSDIEDYSTYADYSLIDDSRIKYYSPSVVSYPYTIDYEYEINYNGNMFYPEWEIFPDYKVSVESSSFYVISDIENFRFFEKNFSAEYNIKKTIENSYTKWSAENLKAITEEPYSLALHEYTPVLYTAPENFIMDGFQGNMSTWENFGKWIYKLNYQRDILPEATKQKIDDLINGITDTTEIVKILYEYMQSKTRYVSIQLGIGGWQPFDAQFVDEKGYGDCKALSNYMFSILKYADIKSHYTLVKAGENAENMTVGFTKSQFNHAILCVPLSSDTIWLECTSQKNPFGYIGNFTDNRNVLIIDTLGGKIAKTKKYLQQQNIKTTKADINIDSTGSAIADLNITYSGLMYEEANIFLYITTDEQKKYLYSTIGIPDFAIINYNISEHEDYIPSINQQITILSEKYATCTGKRIFVPLNCLNKITEAPVSVDNRKTEIVIKRPYIVADTINFNLPLNYIYEYLSLDKTITSDFGEYKTEILKIDNNHFTYIRNLKFNEGTFSPEKYSDLIDFYKQIIKADNEKIVIVKN